MSTNHIIEKRKRFIMMKRNFNQLLPKAFYTLKKADKSRL
jgi:hypothetical protein